MGDCEICGMAAASKQAVIEGVKFKVCERCARHGKVIVERTAIKKSVKVSSHKQGAQQEIIDNFSSVLKKRISSEGIKYKDLARSINEKESYLKRVVNGETTPTLKLAKKLENRLGVKLIEEVE